MEKKEARKRERNEGKEKEKLFPVFNNIAEKRRT